MQFLFLIEKFDDNLHTTVHTVRRSCTDLLKLLYLQLNNQYRIHITKFESLTIWYEEDKQANVKVNKTWNILMSWEAMKQQGDKQLWSMLSSIWNITLVQIHNNVMWETQKSVGYSCMFSYMFLMWNIPIEFIEYFEYRITLLWIWIMFWSEKSHHINNSYKMFTSSLQHTRVRKLVLWDSIIKRVNPPHFLVSHCTYLSEIDKHDGCKLTNK